MNSYFFIDLLHQVARLGEELLASIEEEAWRLLVRGI